MFQCYSLKSSHLHSPPLWPQICSLCLHLHCRPVDKFLNTIFLDSIYICINIQYLSFSFWLTSLHIESSTFFYLIRTDLCILFIAVEYSIVYTYHNFFIHLSVDGHLGCFHVLAIVNSVAMNTGVHVSFSIMVFSEYLPSSRIAGSDGSFIPSILWHLHTVLRSGCIHLHSHQQSTPSPAYIICGLFDDCHSDQCEMIPHCRPMEQDRKPGDKPTHLWAPYLWKRRQKYTMEKDSPFNKRCW